jgi:hypothetical protein
MDELLFEELSLRRTQEKMDDAFCEALLKAIGAGERADRRLKTAQHQESENSDSCPGSFRRGRQFRCDLLRVAKKHACEIE